MNKINLKDMKTIIAYKEGNNWIVNVNGVLLNLHHNIRSKSDVKRWFADAQNNNEYEGCNIVFA